MATLVYFDKSAEDPTQVRYAFGRSPEELTRELVVDKETQKGRPVDGMADGMFRGGLGKILVRRHRDGTWPEKGVLQS